MEDDGHACFLPTDHNLRSDARGSTRAGERCAQGNQMRDMQAHLEKLRTETAECEMIARLATDRAKQELFAKLAEHYKVLASELERAIKQKEAG